MAEPEDQDKRAPSPLEDDFDDDLVGFAHPRALEPSRSPEPEPAPEPELEPLEEPERSSPIEPETPAEAEAAEPLGSAEGPEPTDPPADAPLAPTDGLTDDFGRPGATRTFDRGPTRPSEPGVTADGDGRLAMAIYICLIGAAPSAGVTLVIALVLAWMARFMIKGWTRSHLLYQLRTSLIGTIGGVVGVLTLPLGLGVFVLSLTLLWVVVRGAAGLYRLVRRQPVRDPQTWSLP
jgi:uncharacterized membrane protein